MPVEKHSSVMPLSFRLENVGYSRRFIKSSFKNYTVMSPLAGTGYQSLTTTTANMVHSRTVSPCSSAMPSLGICCEFSMQLSWHSTSRCIPSCPTRSGQSNSLASLLMMATSLVSTSVKSNSDSLFPETQYIHQRTSNVQFRTSMYGNRSLMSH